MTKREKIILSLTGVVALAGLAMLYTGGNKSPSSSSSGTSARQADASAVALMKTIELSSLDKRETDLVAAIGRKWKTSALYDQPLAGVTTTAASKLPRYSGYVELGSGRLAIVDGIEYQVGDSLESGGYKVAAITPEQVVLEILASGKRIEIPYEGQQDATAQ